jgi:hypothetical protein
MAMSLLPFHRILIVSAIVFCAGFSAWTLVGYARTRVTADLLLGLAFALAAGALLVYLLHLRRFLGLPKHREDPHVR